MAPFDTIQATNLRETSLGTSSLLTQEEWSFVKKISDLFPDRHPSISERFEKFEAMAPQQRLKHANAALKQELRRGFVQRIEQGVTPEASLSDVENIHEHSKNMRLILRRIFNSHSDHPYLQEIGEEKKKDMLIKSFRLAAVHDLAEAMTSDFTPVDMQKITASDKTKLEGLASRILFEAFPKKLAMIERYEAKGRLRDERNIDHLNKVVDLLEGGVDCLAMNVSRECFDEWMGTIEQGLKKYQDLSLCFASKALNDLRELRTEMPNLVSDYPDIQQRRVAIMDIIFGESPKISSRKMPREARVA